MTAATMTEHAPFRADQVGSLLRPPELKAAREQRAKGEISAAALAEIEDRLIRAAVKMQEAVGMQAITDGDFRRQSWSSRLPVRHRGCRAGPSAAAPAAGRCAGRRHRARLAAADPEGRRPSWNGQMAASPARRSSSSRERRHAPPKSRFLRQDAAFSRRTRRRRQTAYPDMEHSLPIIGVYRAEIMDLAAAGCRYVQLDDTNLAYLCDPRLRDRVKGLAKTRIACRIFMLG